MLDLVQPFAAWGPLVGFRAEPFQSRAPCRNLELNPELARRIEVLPVAVPARDGEMDFVLSHDIESGMSSGSFLELAKPPRESGDYANFIRRPCRNLELNPELARRIEVLRVAGPARRSQRSRANEQIQSWPHL